MKKPRIIILVAAALITGFLAARWSAAQTVPQPSESDSKVDHTVALKQLESFVAYLQETKQTNTLQRFNDYLSASEAIHQTADLGMNLAVLKRLREGQTNSAMEMLEVRLSGEIIGFVASYRGCPVSIREQISLKPLEYARNYRVKFPFKHRYSNVDDGVAEAFKILDEKAAK